MTKRCTSILLGLGVLCVMSGVSTAVAATPAPSPSPSSSPSASPSPSAAPAPSPQVLKLQQQAIALEQQIQADELQSAPLQAQALQAQQQAADAQQQLATAQVQLATANARLASTTTQLRSVQSTLDSDRKRLSALIVASYKLKAGGSAFMILLNSRNLVDVIDNLVSYNQVSRDMETLVTDVRRKADQWTELQLEQTQEQQQIQSQVNSIQATQSQAEQAEAQFQQQSSVLTDQESVLTQQLQSVMVQLASAEGVQAATIAAGSVDGGSIAGALPPFAFGPQVDNYPWGQCTWYVASLRAVTWGGDAWQWAGAALAAGKQEGLEPKQGAIVVWGPGNGYSDVGHVAYVESVTGPTSFIVDEANVFGLGVADKRAVTTLDDVEAFIY